MKLHNTLHPDLLRAQELAYKPLGFICDKLTQEIESQEYGACTFEINNKIIKFRVAKITPTKIGQFVTFWKRIGIGPIIPYDASDQFDFLIVSVRAHNNLGQFVFPRSVLLKHGLLSKNSIGGKRALRVYPPWDIPNNPQAKKTQDWQHMYFFTILPTTEIDQAKRLLL